MDQTVTKALRIDGDSHFFPPVDFTDIAEQSGAPESAIRVLLRDTEVFADRNARRGGFKATAAGKKVGAIAQAGTQSQASAGPIGHGIAEQRVELLPETGFDMQVLIPDGIYANAFGAPVGRDWGPGLHMALSMSYNNAVAAAQKAYPDQLIACGVVPFGSEDLDSCIAEAKRAANDLGVKALMINSNWRGENWDSLELYPFWDVVNQLGVPLYIHGNPFLCRVNDHVPSNYTIGWERMRRLHISNYIGFGFEYMMCMASLTLGGLLTDFPNLRFAFYEAGASWLPWAMYTLDRTFEVEPQCARCDTKPSEQIRETTMVGAEPDEFSLAGAVQTIGSKNIVLGSDYPHPPSTYPNTVTGLLEMEGLSEEAKEDILGLNLKRFFNI
ncbi:MAG: amidohydrolase [Rhodospirillales bacterium]|nr:amidohydrolase [Rhodospirillales bacterium]